MEPNTAYKKGFIPYALAAFLIGMVGGFSTVLGPAFVRDLNIAYSNTTWTSLAQAMSTAACAPILGKLGDVIGRKTTLFLGLGVFTLGNVLSALANSLVMMLFARFTVGVGTAAMAPVILAYIVSEFPPSQVTKGFSLYMLISSASVIFGPTLGGTIIARWGWRAMLWVCVVLCAVISALCLLTATKGETQRKKLQNFDGYGSLWVVIFFSLMLCVPSFGQNFGWISPAFWLVLLAAVISLLALIYVEKRAKFPILPFGFMKSRAFLLSVLALFLTQGLMQANMTNLIVFVNYTQPANSVLSGYAISVMYLGMSLGAILLGPLADRFEPKFVLVFSLLCTGLGCGLLFFFSAATSLGIMMASLGLLGLGLGGNGTILMKVALSRLPKAHTGAATGTYGLFRDLSAPFGVAVLVPLFTNQITRLISAGFTEVQSALRSIHTLSAVELLCVAGGIVTVFFLPKIHQGGTNHAIEG